MSAIRLWSIQPLPVWERLLRIGRVSGDGRRGFAREYSHAYRWMMAQMQRRVAGYRGGYPIWAWYEPMPDLRYANRLAKGEAGVRIELTVNKDRVLLSDFDTWHMVLNDSFLARNEREWGRLQRSGSQHEKRHTWERIFDLRSRPYDGWLGRLTHVQAVIEEVRLDDVVSVQRFVSR